MLNNIAISIKTKSDSLLYKCNKISNDRLTIISKHHQIISKHHQIKTKRYYPISSDNIRIIRDHKIGTFVDAVLISEMIYRHDFPDKL